MIVGFCKVSVGDKFYVVCFNYSNIYGVKLCCKDEECIFV